MLGSSLIDQAAAIAEGEVSSAELVGESLRAIEALEPELNAFKLLRGEEALAEAAQADRRRRAGGEGILLGVPVAIKDDTDLAGHPTAFGTELELPPVAEDAELVKRLRAAGAIIVGKTNTPEFGQWPITEGPGFGVTRNPWDPAHTPGGSSGGSAAVVAARGLAAAVGSDGAGSVRIPAAWCGLVGLKTQRGRVSCWPEPRPFKGLTSFGPLARTIDDAALLLDAIAGQHPDDLDKPPPPPAPYRELARQDPGRLRIALSFRPAWAAIPARVGSEARAATERIASVLAEMGHEIVDRDPSYGPVGLGFLPRAWAGIAEWAARMPDSERLDPRTKAVARTGRLLGGRALAFARGRDRALQHRVGRIFDEVDLVLTPTTAKPPLEVGAIHGLSEHRTDQVIVKACPMCWPWNVLGWPALNVPAGLTGSGLPLGAQLLGPANSEGLLLALGRRLEQRERWPERRPPIAAGAPAAVQADR